MKFRTDPFAPIPPVTSLLAFATNDAAPPDAQAPGSSAPPKKSALSDEARAEVSAMMNGAISNHLTRFRGSMSEDLEKIKGELSSSFSGVLEEFKKSIPASQPAKGKKDDAGDVSKIEAEYSARLADLEKRYNDEKAAREQERQSNLKNEERNTLATVLISKGADPNRVKAAVALLHTEEQRVSRNKDGSIVFKIQREGYADPLPLEKGVEEYLAGEGKFFLAAKPVGGSGGKGNNAPSSNGGTAGESKAELKRRLAASMFGLERG